MTDEKNPASERSICVRCGRLVPRGRACFLGENGDPHCIACALIESRRKAEPAAEELPRFPRGYVS